MMNLKKSCCLYILLLAVNCWAQEETQTKIVPLKKITLIQPGFSYEHPIGKLQSLYFHGPVTLSAYFNYSDYFGFKWDVWVDPAFTFQYRYYYNARRRASKERQTDRNNLNYVGSLVDLVFSNRPLLVTEKRKWRVMTTTGIVWGFQRNYKKHFSLDLNLGPGYYFAKEAKENIYDEVMIVNVARFTTAGHLSLGWWLNKRK